MTMDIQKNIQELRKEISTEIHSLQSTKGVFKSGLDMVGERINEKESGEEETKKLRHRKKDL